MRGKIEKILFLTVFMVLCFGNTVWGYTGKGTSAKPYVITSEKELREIITEKYKSSWVYIAMNDTIAITKTLTVDEGKFRIYAINGPKTLRRSKKLNVDVNAELYSKYCMKVTGSAQVVLGYGDHDLLTVDGSADVMENNRWESNGWLHVNFSATATIGKSCRMTNLLNNVWHDDNAVIFSRGTLIVNGEISYAKGKNGGAIKSKDGTIEIGSTAKIHHCSAATEGGAIHASVGTIINMNGGKIYNCTAGEEGGAIFVRGGVKCYINSGEIFNNSAGASAGGVFAGYGATLCVGTTSGSGPRIYNNTAAGSGGGIRCNGGKGEQAGGVSYFYGGQVSNNNSGKYGGGISFGEPGEKNTGKAMMRNMIISGNSCEIDGGGVKIPENTKGVSNDEIQMENCRITYNTAKKNGGGLLLMARAYGLNMEVSNNKASEYGGGIYIGTKGDLVYKNNGVMRNESGNKGSGVFVHGKFKMADRAFVSSENIVYLKTGTYIEIIERLSMTAGYLANIESEDKNNGTKIVKVSYGGGNAGEDLYYSGNAQKEYDESLVFKKYTLTGYRASQLIRPGNNVAGSDSSWIIVSEKYNISYDKNTTDSVANLPQPQIKFWNESIRLSDKKIERENAEINKETHWNFNRDGSGKCVLPGAEFRDNENRILFAQWKETGITQLTIYATDRYYMVGQNIVLNNQEVLKKVTVEDDRNSQIKYDIHVVKIEYAGKTVSQKGENMATENYMTTAQSGFYRMTLQSSDKSGKVVANAIMTVYVLDTMIQNNQVRYISYNYLHTLQEKSKWNRNPNLNGNLRRSLEKERGNGIYKIQINPKQMYEIKKEIRENHYQITQNLNQQVAKLLKIEEVKK